MSSQNWNTLSKQDKTTLLKSAGLPAGLSQLSWSGFSKTERAKLEMALKSKGKGWHEKKEEVVTKKGIEKKAPIHREVAIKERDKDLLNQPIIPQKKEEPIREVQQAEPQKEWKKPEMPHEWYEDFKIKYVPNLKSEARTEYYQKQIMVGRKFFELPDEKVKIWTIAHEVGHLFEQMTRELQLSLAGGEASKRLGVIKRDHYDGFLGGYNPSEAYADAVAEMYTRPNWLKTTHPKIHSLIEETVPIDWKEAIDYFISESGRGVESEYRLDKSQEVGEYIATQIKPPYQVIRINGSNIEYTSPHHEGHIMFQGREHAEGIQKALEDVTEVIQSVQSIIEKAPHIRGYYKFKLTDLKKDINFNKPYLNLVYGLRPVKEYFGRGSATISARGIKFWWFKPEDSRQHFIENPYYSIEATPPATIAHEIAHTLGSDNEFIDPLAKIVAIMFYTKHREYLPQDSFSYMKYEIGRITDDIVIGKPKRPAVTAELLKIFYAEYPLELAAVIGAQYSKEDGDKVWAFMAQEKKKAEKPQHDNRTDEQILKDLEIEYNSPNRRAFKDLTPREQDAINRDVIRKYPITSAYIGALATISGTEDKALKEFNKAIKEEVQIQGSSNKEKEMVRDTKIKTALYQGFTYRRAIEDAVSNLEVELKGGRVRVDGKRFTHLDKDNSLMSDPAYETKFWLEAYNDGKLLKLLLNRAEVDYYNKLKSEYKKPEPVKEIETPERTRFYLQDRVDNARRELQQWTKVNDTAMIKTWGRYLAEREKELTEFDAGTSKKEIENPKQTEPQIQPTHNKGITWDATFSIGIPRKDGSTRRVNKSITDLKVSSHQEAEVEVLKRYPKAYYIHIIQNIPSSTKGVE